MRYATVILSGFLAGCQPQHCPAPAPADSLGLDYAAWPSVTEKPYRVSPSLAMFCRALTPDEARQQQAERKERGPHADTAIVVRVNPIGLEAFRAGEPVPVGTVVIKEKYPLHLPNTPPDAVAAMIKREPGYDPDHGDWEYAYEQRKAEPENKVVRGKLSHCIACHKGARSDYLFRPYLSAAR
jgi:hypothetical protein